MSRQLRAMNHQVSVVPPASRGQKPLPFAIREESPANNGKHESKTDKENCGPRDLQADDLCGREGVSPSPSKGVKNNAAALEMLLGQLEESQRKYQKALDKIRARDQDIQKYKKEAKEAKEELQKLKAEASQDKEGGGGDTSLNTSTSSTSAKKMLDDVMGKMEYANIQLSQLQEEVTALKSRLESANSVAEAERARASSLESELDNVKSLLEKTKKVLTPRGLTEEESPAENVLKIKVDALEQQLNKSLQGHAEAREEIASLRERMAEGGFGATEFKKQLEDERRANAELKASLDQAEAKAIMDRTETRDSLSKSLRTEIDAKNAEIKQLNAAYVRAKNDADAFAAKFANLTLTADASERKHRLTQSRQELLVKELASIRKDVIKLVNKRNAIESALDSCVCGVVESAAAAWKNLSSTEWESTDIADSLLPVTSSANWKTKSCPDLINHVSCHHRIHTGSERRSLCLLESLNLPGLGAPPSLLTDAMYASQPSAKHPSRPSLLEEAKLLYQSSGAIGVKPSSAGPTTGSSVSDIHILTQTQHLLDTLTLAANPTTMRIALDKYKPKAPPLLTSPDVPAEAGSATSSLASSPDEANDMIPQLRGVSPVRLNSSWELGLEHEEMTPNGSIVRTKTALPHITEESSIDQSPSGKTPGRDKGSLAKMGGFMPKGGSWA